MTAPDTQPDTSADVAALRRDLEAASLYRQVRAHTYSALRFHDLLAYHRAGVPVTSAEGDAYADWLKARVMQTWLGGGTDVSRIEKLLASCTEQLQQERQQVCAAWQQTQKPDLSLADSSQRLLALVFAMSEWQGPNVMLSCSLAPYGIKLMTGYKYSKVSAGVAAHQLHDAGLIHVEFGQQRARGVHGTSNIYRILYHQDPANLTSPIPGVGLVKLEAHGGLIAPEDAKYACGCPRLMRWQWRDLDSGIYKIQKRNRLEMAKKREQNERIRQDAAAVAAERDGVGEHGNVQVEQVILP